MKRSMCMLVIFVLTGAVSVSSAFVQNPTFNSDINDWYTAYTNNPTAPTWGTAEWSSLHGGSAKLHVDGAPSAVYLISFTTEAIQAGQAIEMAVDITDCGNFGEIVFSLGSDGYKWLDEVRYQRPAGEYVLSITASRAYPAGTPISMHLVVWPGAITCYVKEVRRAPGGILSHEDTRLPEMHLAVSPSPMTQGASVSFYLHSASEGTVAVYDINGRQVRQFIGGVLAAGNHSYAWDGLDASFNRVSDGTYFVRLQTLYGEEVRSLVLSR